MDLEYFFPWEKTSKTFSPFLILRGAKKVFSFRKVILGLYKIIGNIIRMKSFQLFSKFLCLQYRFTCTESTDKSCNPFKTSLLAQDLFPIYSTTFHYSSHCETQNPCWVFRFYPWVESFVSFFSNDCFPNFERHWSEDRKLKGKSSFGSNICERDLGHWFKQSIMSERILI